MKKGERKLTDPQVRTIKDGARKLTGAKRRAFQAQVTLDHLEGNVRQAESVFGWSRKTVELGLNELRTGITCIGNFGLRGRPRVGCSISHRKAAKCSRTFHVGSQGTPTACEHGGPEVRVDPPLDINGAHRCHRLADDRGG
jgi:hypothetical protein